MKNERTVYTTCWCFPFILFSSCKRKNENGYNGSYFYFSFFVWGLEKRKRMLSYSFSIFYYEIEKRKTKGRYIHGPARRSMHPLPRSETVIRKWKSPSLYLYSVFSSSKGKRKNGWRFDRCCHRAKASARETLRRKRLTYCGWRCILT